MQRRHLWANAAALLITAAPASASLETVIGSVSAVDPRHVLVQVRLLNTGPDLLSVAPSSQLNASVKFDGETIPLVLNRSGAAELIMLAAGAFVTRSFEATLPDRPAGKTAALLSLPDGSSFTFRMPAGERAPAVDVAATGPVSATGPVAEKTVSSPRADTGNAFLHNLSAYDPIYAVYGPGTDSDAKIQISFKYQLFGRANDPDSEGNWLSGLHFAYTQRLYWDLGKKSSPFRNVDYMPELVYIVGARPAGSNTVFGGQLGLRHESNGRDGADSRSLNTIYLQPVATIPLGRYRLSVGPRIWAFVGNLSDNPDVKRYRGNTGLFAEIGTDKGIRLTTNSRFNPGSGKGSIDASASYPLDAWIPALNLYVFGQAFAGYGENLLDYDRHQTRLRFGFGIVR